jgi:O-methyltransferase involved in polyketide biosynthesis
VSRVSVATLKGVPATLLIPLVARAIARERHPELGFADPGAEAVLARLDARPEDYAWDAITMRAAVERAQAFDRIAAAFFAAHPDGVGASLGAGLCTRAHRVDNGRRFWLDVDLPEVIAIKRQLVDEGERYRLFAGSILEDGWIAQLPAGRPTLLLSEGVLIYFSPAQLDALLATIAARFRSGTELAFDYAHPLVKLASRVHPSLRRSGSRFAFAARDAQAIAARNPRYELVAQVPFMRAGFAGKLERAANRLIDRSFYGIAHLRLR